MKLKTNFSDYYDYAFDGQGETFYRMVGNVGPNKQEQLSLLKQAGLKIPMSGKVCDVLESWDEEEKHWVKWVVAYTDEMAHSGEGKRLLNKGMISSNPDMSGIDRYAKEKELFCTAYISKNYQNPYFCPGLSWRMLQIGFNRFWIEYKSDDSWMSNCGSDGSCEIIGIEKDCGYDPVLNYPLYAVDFVFGVKDAYAIDLNVSPGIRQSGVEKIFSAQEVVNSIQDWFSYNESQRA